MAHGAPDWVRMVQVAVTVDLVPVVPKETEQRAAGAVGRKANATTGYLTVASWEVAADMVGELKEILILSDDYVNSVFQVTVGDVVWATNWQMKSSMPIIFEDLKLAAGKIVLVEVKSNGTDTVTVDAIIVGKEIG